MIIDTSATPMAPMMSVPASSPTQALIDLNGTDEIWVFGNGIEGSGVMGFQPGVFDNQAGEPAWSPFWNHFTLTWTDGSDVRVLRSGDERKPVEGRPAPQKRRTSMGVFPAIPFTIVKQ